MVYPFLTAEKLWRDALDCEFANEQLLEDLRILEYVISVGFNL